VGFLTGLVTFPLAPVRGTVWLAEKIAEQAEHELSDESAIRRRLTEVEIQHDMGEIDDEEFAAAESALLDELMRARGA
jgi:Gas vesicle protein G